ncbi:MAG: hypothetical protein CL920_24545 [Deltaproteobacteria bacterium]|nr:hypothetical protein [Deltaproteobacteria bacterium]|tara:strand:- start:34074 stop:34301 length:228 start_codon:yes stop_codon:yes gene_type:complete
MAESFYQAVSSVLFIAINTHNALCERWFFGGCDPKKWREEVDFQMRDEEKTLLRVMFCTLDEQSAGSLGCELIAE